MGNACSAPAVPPDLDADASLTEREFEQATVAQFRNVYEDELARPAEKPPRWRSASLVMYRFEDRMHARDVRRLTESPSDFFAGPKPFSSTPLAQLRRIELQAMSVYKRHEGTYLLMRLVTFPETGVGVSFVGQTPKGTACEVELFSSPSVLATAGELEILAPLDQDIAVREPYLRLNDKGEPKISIYSPTDLLPIDSRDVTDGITWQASVTGPVFRTYTVDERKKMGDICFADGWFQAADRSYTRAIQLGPSRETGVTLRLNRAQARLKLGRFRSALVDTKFVLLLERSALSAAQREKALFRAASAAYGLGMWGSAKERFQELLVCNPRSIEGKAGVRKANERLKEARTGVFDWAALFDGSLKDAHVDLADYVSPDVVVADLGKERGRGIIAQRDIAAGTLLMVVKPAVHSCWKEVPKARRDLRVVNLHTNTVDDAVATTLCIKIIDRLMDDPSFVDIFNLLCSSPTGPTPSCFSVAKVLKAKADPRPAQAAVDTARVERIVSFNALPISSLRVPTTSVSSADDEPRVPLGLYALPSLLNHACYRPSCFYGFVGDAMFVRATRDLKKGEEATIDYAADQTTVGRADLLKKHGLYPCKCALCAEDRNESDVARAEWRELCASVPSPVAASGKGARPARERRLGEAEAWLDAVESAYDPSHPKHLRQSAFSALYLAATICADIASTSKSFKAGQKWHDRAIRWANAALLSVDGGQYEPETGAVESTIPHGQHDRCVALYVVLAGAAKAKRRAAASEALLRAALRLHERCVGGQALFFRRFGELLAAYGLDAYGLA